MNTLTRKMRPSCKVPTGKNFDELQVERLRAIIRSQKNGGSIAISLPELFRLLHKSWRDTIDNNPYYKKTPACFRSSSIFFVQLTKAIHAELKVTSFESTLLFIYNNVVVMSPSICSIPDVAMSEAKRILKRIE